jgi:hypothetical protein
LEGFGSLERVVLAREKTIKIPVNGPTLDFISIPPKTEGFQKKCAHPPS